MGLSGALIEKGHMTTFLINTLIILFRRSKPEAPQPLTNNHPGILLMIFKRRLVDTIKIDVFKAISQHQTVDQIHTIIIVKTRHDKKRPIE